MSDKKTVSSAESRADAYTKAGVDIHAGNSLVERIKQHVSSTHINGVLSDIGGFGGLFKPDLCGMESPLLVASTDGVGTKLKLAFEFDKHDTIGIDLVAMSVNDILVQGAKPLFFLDYFATGKLNVAVAEQVVAGVAEGCRQSSCALLGGETAEMPDMYAAGEYDLAGFCVGIVDNKALVDGSSVRVGHKLIGIASSGPHSNGYSLIRKIVKESGLSATDTIPGSDRPLGELLLEPTQIYVECITNLMRDFTIDGMVHITGGGFYDNIPRVLPAQVGVDIPFGSWEMPAVFSWLKEAGNLSWPEMLQIFNCGIGYVLVVSNEQVEDILDRISALHLKAWEIGTVTKLTDTNIERVNILFDAE